MGKFYFHAVLRLSTARASVSPLVIMGTVTCLCGLETFTTAQQGECNYSPFADGETEAQRADVLSGAWRKQSPDSHLSAPHSGGGVLCGSLLLLSSFPATASQCDQKPYSRVPLSKKGTGRTGKQGVQLIKGVPGWIHAESTSTALGFKWPGKVERPSPGEPIKCK